MIKQNKYRFPICDLIPLRHMSGIELPTRTAYVAIRASAWPSFKGGTAEALFLFVPDLETLTAASGAAVLLCLPCAFLDIVESFS